jgi:hypothetical protein
VAKWRPYVQLDTVDAKLDSRASRPDHTYQLRSLSAQITAGVHVELATQAVKDLIAEESELQGAQLEALWRITLGALA